MGRTKTFPTRRQHNDGYENNETMLGRLTLDRDASVDAMVAAEIGEDRTEQALRHQQQQQQLQRDIDHPLEARGEERKSRLAEVLARVEKEEADKLKKKRTKVQKKKRATIKIAKTVSFASEQENSTIPPPEIRVMYEEEAGSRWQVLYYCARGSAAPSEDASEVSGNDEFWELGSYSLPRVLEIRFVGQVESNDKPIDIRSSQGAIDVWNLLHAHSFSHHRECVQALGRAVKEGTVSLKISSGRQRLEIALTMHALKACSRARLPLTDRSRQKGKRHQTSHDLHMVLSLLFPGTEIADALLLREKKESTLAVTAKQVYALTDNLQLTAALSRQRSDDEPLVVPGLVPTLRPYQEMAVKWMLQRENSSSSSENINTNDSEWELAWVVLTPDSSRDGFPSMTPLFEWKDRLKSEEATLGLLFCPFTGWLAEGPDQARAMTMTISSEVAPIRGGILAESMGLGKTVELIACILANPRPRVAPADLPDRSESPTARRQLEFTKPLSGASASDAGVDEPISTPNIGSVEDMSEFCEAETDDDDDDDGNAEPVSISDNFTIASSGMPAAMPVTPENENNATPIEERFVDEDELGACICGSLIGFSTDNGPGPVILCRSCNEPMHMQCTTFLSKEQMERETKPLRIMRTFSNTLMDCRVCEKQRCPCCVEPLETDATVIITPPSILAQWKIEIEKHARNVEGEYLKVVVYDGIKRLAQTNSVAKECAAIRCMHPSTLAGADVVLLTFDALMSDLGHTDENRYIQKDTDEVQAGNLRKRKRYRVVPSPLLSIKWWRVCLDEAQRVETPTAGSAKMAKKLKACNRWCVSGTPVGRGKLEDVFGLLSFLRLDPFLEKLWFRKCFNPAYRNLDGRISHLLKHVFWRSTKGLETVRAQMGVPDQTERKIFLKFSSIEKHFYQRQLEQVLSAVGDIADRTGNGGNRKSSQLFLLAEHVHRLRAACLHPQVGLSGIGSVKRSRGSNTSAETNTIGSHVMTMRQILDTFIDDTKQQCEEAQRIVVLHTNGMAACSKLKVEAKARGVAIPGSEKELLDTSCKMYLESLRLSDENASPTLVLREARLGGSVGFRSMQKKVQNCAFCMDWKWTGKSAKKEIWSNFELTSRPAKITQLRLRAVREIPKSVSEEVSDSFTWHLAYPKDCRLETMSAAGEYVVVHAFSMPHPNDEETQGNHSGWILENGFRSNKSKSWRIVVNNLHAHGIEGEDDGRASESHSCGTYVGIDVDFYEATIASDPLQRLHCLHNASLSFASLLQLEEIGSASEGDDLRDDTLPPTEAAEMRRKMEAMSTEAIKIESWYLDSARAIHSAHHKRLMDASAVRRRHEHELLDSVDASLTDCWDTRWFDDFLVICRLHGSGEQQRIVCDRILQELDGVLGAPESTGIVPFPLFRDINGLRTALQMRIHKIRSAAGLGTSNSARRGPVIARSDENDLPTPRDARFKCTQGAHARCMQSILDLSQSPTDGEMLENSRCKVCKADWFQTGPKCRHCKIGEELEDLQTPDKVTMLVLNSLYTLMKGNFGSSLFKVAKASTDIIQHAKKFFEVMEASKREHVTASRKWRTHLDLLNDFDELNQCKRAMRLTFENEDVTELTEDQLNSVIVPIDICTRFHDHEAKQATALGQLLRAKGTLQYLKNQSAEDEETCSVCLCSFDDTSRAVLRCGHSFHLTPCLAKLQSGGPNSTISCPLRCRVRTGPNEYKIASEKAHDDGSRSKRRIKGSWGTKVSRLVSDVLEVCETGDKSLVFSQWDDMLEICEQALVENGVTLVRVASLRQIGECTRRFRSPDCSVMLLNVKNGAEGLTLIEATHVFMVEPLLNCGLDSQAINRIHRIGQNRKTTVWRYIVEDTVEVKIDKRRTEDQEDQLEDSKGKKSLIGAGGIDGGFKSQEELLQMLQPP